MENNHNAPYFPFLLTFLFIILTLVWRILKKSSDKAPKLPPGPPKLPIIGNLHLLIGKLPHYFLKDLATKYGPIMQLQLGEIPTVVFSSAETAKEVFKTHDLSLATRPRIHALKLLTYNHTDLVLAPYGDYWRQIRKICTVELFSPSRVQSFRPIREEEASNLIRDISSNAGSIINLTEMLFSTSLSIISRATIGEKSRYQEDFNKHVPNIMGLFGGRSLVDLFPSWKILHLIHAMNPKYKKIHLQADRILDNIVMEHKAKKAATVLNATTVDVDDFLSVLLDLQDHGELEVPLTSENIKAIILDMFLGGGDTIAVTIDWAMSVLLKNPRVMKKAQTEVRNVFTSKGRVDEEGLRELKYLKAVIKETLRLHPPGPLMVPRESRERCEISGYEIPAKSRVLVNVWAIGRDPNYWTEAENFFPERFLDRNIDYRGNDFEFIPFGSGRRKCIGFPFAPPVLELLLASLLYHFDWKLTDGQTPENFDMTEIFRAVSKRRHDLHLVPVPYRPPYAF